MGLFSKDIKSMNDLFVHTLRDIYYAEKQIVKALPGMVEKSTDPQLKQGFQTHLRETENHVKRLEQAFQLIGEKAQGVDCPAIDGILEEADDVTGEVEQKSVLDAALIAAAQAVAVLSAERTTELEDDIGGPVQELAEIAQAIFRSEVEVDAHVNATLSIVAIKRTRVSELGHEGGDAA